MNATIGTAARQLTLIDDADQAFGPPTRPAVRRHLRLLREDVYAELLRRRHRAQIAARRLLEGRDGQPTPRG